MFAGVIRGLAAGKIRRLHSRGRFGFPERIRIDHVSVFHGVGRRAEHFRRFAQNGMVLNLMSLGVTGLGALITFLIFKFGNISLPEVLGLYSGAVTSTPGFGGRAADFGRIGR